MSKSDIERQGREAFQAARRRGECPYTHGPNRKAWLKGYDQSAQTACFA